MLLSECLLNSARRFPDHEIVVQGEKRISYEVMSRKVSALASFLRSEGIVAKGDRVGVCMENSPEYVLAYFAILEAGGVIVPISNQTTSRGLHSILGDCGTSTLFIQNTLVKVVVEAVRELPALKTVILAGNGDAEEHRVREMKSGVLARGSRLFDLNDIGRRNMDQGHVCTAEANDLAMIIYTSGTTAEPKGVMLTHRNLASNAESIVDYLKLTPEDRVMVVLPFYYSYGNSLLTTHVMVGGTLVLENSFMYPNVVLDRMVKERVTGFSGVPSTFAILLNRSNIRKYAFPSLRYVTQAGGAMSPTHARELSKVLPEAVIFIMYGQTEATARLTYLDPRELVRKAGSIGKAIPGVKITIRKENSRVAAPGETGEIVAEGENIMKGYWRRPEETAKVLTERGLRTGDMARMDEEGFLFIVGRNSEMIKSGAHRISPKEIEEVILEIPEVHETAVVGVKDEILGEVIHAYVVPKGNQAPDPRVVLAYCRDNLPPFKIPKKIHIVAGLPKTDSGKIKKYEIHRA